MPVIKPKGDWRDEESGRYSGPLPTPGPYNGVIHGIWFNQIKNGANEGEDQYTVSVKIVEGPFKGFTTLHNLPQLKQNAWGTNQFLDSLTDGSEKQRTVLRNWFYEFGCDVGEESEANKLGVPVNGIVKKGNKVGFTFVGKKTAFVLKKDFYNDEERRVVDRFVVSMEDATPEDNSDDDGMVDSAPAEKEPEPEKPEPAAEPETEELPTEGDEEDGDDPWS